MHDGSGYDNTNSGIIFQPHQDQTLSGQGKINIDGADHQLVIIRQPIKRDGALELVVYQKIGVLFVNEKKENEKAPQFSGPVDGGKRLAAWTGEKDGRRYMSLKISDRDGGQRRQGDDRSAPPAQQNDGWGGNDFPDDEIPF